MVCARHALLGSLSHVLRRAVNVHDQRFQLLAKTDVIVWTAESTGMPELIERHPADRAGPLVQPRQILSRLPHFQMLGQYAGQTRSRLLGLIRLGQVDPCVLFAEMQLRRLVARQFRDVKGRGFLAVLALHGRTSIGRVLDIHPERQADPSRNGQADLQVTRA